MFYNISFQPKNPYRKGKNNTHCQPEDEAELAGSIQSQLCARCDQECWELIPEAL